MRIGLGHALGLAALCALGTTACGGAEAALAPTSAASQVISPPAPDAGARPEAPSRLQTPILASAAVEAGPDPRPAVADPPPPAPRDGPELPNEPYSVLIVGGSLAATGIGALLERELDAHPHIEAHRKGKSASGLARPDFFDWTGEAKRQIELYDPDLVIVILGGNDGQDLVRLRSEDGPRVSFRDEAWADAYRERVDGFLTTLTSEGAEVLWVGPPTMGLTSLEHKLVTIRDVHENAVEALGARGIYLDTVPLVSDIEGKLLSNVPGSGTSSPQKLRSDDRIHFTMAGSEYLAGQIGASVLQALALPNVEPDDG